MHKLSCILPGVSKKAKLLRKLMAGNQDRSFTFEEAEQLLKYAGFVDDGGKGSHRVYRHPDGRKQVLPYHGKEVKPAYIRQIRNQLS